jgi:uncharacterized membrane protein YfcA
MNQSTTVTGYTVAGVSGVALILVMLLFAWFGLPRDGGIDAFKSFHDWALFFLIFTAFAGMALALIGAAGTRVDLPVTLSAITTALGVIAFVILLIYLISPPSYSVTGFVSVSLDRKVGIWLGLIATAGVALGGYMAMQEEGTAAVDASRSRRPAPPPGAP